MFCKTCGNQIDDNVMFCPICGAPVQPRQQDGNQFFDQQQQGGNRYFDQPQQGSSQYYGGTQQGVGQQYYRQPQQGGNQYFDQPQQMISPQYGQPNQSRHPMQPPTPGKSNTGLIIGIICGVAALCLILVALFAFDVFGLRDKDSDDVAEATTTAAYDEPEAHDENTTADTETIAANYDGPYGEAVGYVFVDPSEATVKDAGYPKISDENGDLMDIDGDKYMKNYVNEEGINYVAVTDPDENGNVTYVVETYRRLDTDFKKFPNGDKQFQWSLHFWLYDVSDYYTGKIIGNTGGKRGSVKVPQTKQIEYNGKTIDVQVIRYSFSDPGQELEYDDSTGLYHDSYTRHYYYYITVPQDYDGLVMSVPKHYDHSTNKSHEDDPSIPESIDDETSPLMDVDYYGYTTVEDTVFVRLSDCAVPFTPEMESKIMDTDGNTAFSLFDWYLDALDAGQNGDENIGKYNPIAGKITDPERLSGQWQALIVWDPDNKLGCYEKEYSLADVSGFGSEVSITFNPKISANAQNEETDISSRDSYGFNAEMADDGSIDFNPEGMAFTIDYFYSDGIMQYAFGNMILQDGTEGRVVLQRP